MDDMTTLADQDPQQDSSPAAATQDGSAGLARTGSPRHLPGSPVFAKGRAAWLAVRTKLQSELDAVLKAVAARAAGDGGLVSEIEKLVEPIMAQLDDSLAHKLDEIASTANPGVHARLVQEAQAILDRYKAFASGDKTVAHLDKNPVRPVALGKTLEAALAALSKVIHTSDTGAADAGNAREPAQ